MAKVWKVKDQQGQVYDVDEQKLPNAEKDGFLPIVSNGKDEHRVALNDLSTAMKDGFSPIFSEEKTPKIVSAVRSAAQGITGSFSDEIAGAFEGAGRAVGIDGLGGPVKNISISKDGPTADWEILKDAYKRARDKERESLKTDAKDNPITSTTAQIAGSIISPINKVAKGVGLLRGGAKIGAVTAAGMSDADTAAGVVEDVAKGTALGGASGYAVGKAQDIVGKAAKSLAQKISSPKQKMNSSEIIKAADQLGIKVTPGMLDDTGFVERLESVLAKSPSMFGQSVARNRDAVIGRLNSAGQELTEGATNMTPFQLGEKFKSGVTAKVGERLDPISTVFNEVAESTKFMPVSEKSLNAVTKNIENLDVYKLTGGAGKPGQYVDMIKRIENADQVKTTMTLLNNDIRAAQGAEKQVLIAMKNKLGALEKNTIMRGAIATAKQGGMREATGKNIGAEIVGDLKEARKGYRELSQDLTGVAENARLKTQKGPTAFLDSLESIPSERIQDKFFNVENNRQLMSLKDKFPDEFGLLKQGKLKDVLDSSVDNSLNGQGKFNSQKFLKAVGDLNDEAKNMLFGDKKSVIKNIETIQRSLPRNFNPSGTASEIGWQDSIMKNVKDIPTYAIYRAASSNLAKDISDNLMRAPQMVQIYQKSPQAFQSIVQKIEQSSGILSTSSNKLPSSADKKEKGQEPIASLKGKQKWAVDGLSKIIAHDKSRRFANENAIEEILSSKKGQNLLIRASDLAPGSKSMDKIMTEIQSINPRGRE